ncbi:MAG TPA: energy transducer TonB [Pyrinomonadaceae bacterium]|nr:energy transducer TonB [Pyrinomonadaceae bacterium]
MKLRTGIAIVLLSLLPAAAGLAPARGQDGKRSEARTCESPVYSAREVSRRAKITQRPMPDMTDEFLVKQMSGRGRLTAILCKTGEVTDIEVVRGLPFGMNERMIKAVRNVKFTPAEKGGEAVSQRMIFEFHFNAH